MWPGLHLPSLTKPAPAEPSSRPPPPPPSFDKDPGVENLETLLRVSAGGTRDFILPASCLDELPPNASKSAIREILHKHAIANLPGSGLNYIERCGGIKKVPVCMSGEAGLEAVAKRCRETGFRPELLVSKEGYHFCDSRDTDVTFVPGQSLTLTEDGKKVPYLKPRTRLSAEDRSKLRLPGPRRRAAVDLGGEPQAKVVLVDDEAAAKSRSENAINNILKQIDFIVTESLGFFGAEEETDPTKLLASLAPVLQLLPAPEPPELSLLHEELAASAASVAQEFPTGTVPPERRQSVSEDTGTLRAKAVRIRGSPDSAYPFIKGAAAVSTPALADREAPLGASCSSAVDFVTRCSGSARLWRSLTSHPEVAEWVEKLILEEVRDAGEDGALTQLLVTLSQGKKRKAVQNSTSLAWPPCVRRRLRWKQASSGITWMTKGIACLNINLMATILSSVDFPTKLSAMRVSRGFREILKIEAAWEPLVVEQAVGRKMVLAKRARYRDSKQQPRVPEICFQVPTVDIHLFDAVRPGPDQSDTEDDHNVSACPVLEFLNCWNRSLANVSDLTLRNVDSLTMRILFLPVRCQYLESFSCVNVQRTENDTYCLRATLSEPPLLDCAQVASMNASRIPATVARNEHTKITESEALFLLENPNTYKNGNSIVFIGADHPFDDFPARQIRHAYKDLLESLRKRFPNRFI